MAEFITGIQTGEGVKKYDYLSLGNKPESVSNALKDIGVGAIVRIDDVSPVTHEVNCKIKSKNLFNTKSDYKNGAYIYENTTLTLSARYIHKFIKLEAGRTYTFSCKSTRTGTTGGGVHIRAYMEDEKTYVDLPGGSLISNLSPTVTVTLPAGYPVIRIAFYGHSLETDEGSSTYTEIMLEEGSAATGYVPYVDPASASVTCRGKNIIPYPYYETTLTRYGITFTDNGDGSITINGTATAAAVFYLAYISNIGDTILQANTNSALGGAVTNGVCTFSGGAMYNANYKAIILNIPSGTTVNNVKVYPQAEYGTQATAYEAYRDGGTYLPSEDGTIKGMLSLSPVMTLSVNLENTVVEAQFQRDINSLMKTVPLIDRVTGIAYYLYVSGGKLLIEERGV
jgi:hypothetical protein